MEDVSGVDELSVVGRRAAKVDGFSLLTGEAQYSFDIQLPRMLHGKILRSPHPHARILNIDASKAERLPGVKAVITAEDTPKIKYHFLGHPHEDKYPLAVDKVRFVGDEVAAVAAVDEDTAEEALSLIEVEYELLPAVFDPEEAVQPDAPLIHEGKERNIAAHIVRDIGNWEEALRTAPVVVEDRYTTQPVAQTPMETHGCVAHCDSRGRYTFWASTQASDLLRRELANALGVSLGSVRVVEVFIGGGFGGKAKVGANEALAGLLSKKSGRPVRLFLSRQEEFAASGHRSAQRIRMWTAAEKDGTLLVRRAESCVDNGAYNNVTPAVTGVGGSICTSLYRVPNVRFDGYVVYTNKSWSNAFRGFGAPQVTFAAESQMDRLAEELGMDPVELRLKNVNQPGDVTPVGWRIGTCGMQECIEKAAREIDVGWKKTRRTENGPVKRGRGLAGMIYTVGARAYWDADCAGAFLKIHDDGSASVITGTVDCGQGAKTVLSQIAAETLGMHLEDVRIYTMDTENAPMDSRGASASSVTFISGNAVYHAARKAREKLLAVAAEKLEASGADLDIRNGRVFVRSAPERSMTLEEVAQASTYRQGSEAILESAHYDTPTQFIDHMTGTGNISPAYVFAAHAAEVEVDTETGRVRVVRIAAAHDVGRAINPMLLEGQIEGGLSQGLGYGLTENLASEGGQFVNGNLADYKIFTSKDMPEIVPIIVEAGDPEGPFNAKGIGEPVLVPTAPAIANAIYDAVGVRVKDLPMTPARVFEALRQAREKSS
ncbi:MAG: xanthine dehydrogenase family protein molybdopterin-binding subunit [Nitrospinota bacterium]